MTGIVAMSATDYHADTVGDRPSLSASIAHTLLTKSPLHAWYAHPRLNPNFERKHEDKFDLGTVVHAALLEGDPGPVTAILNYKDWRTDAAKAERDEARAAGLIPILAKDWDTVIAMHDAVRAQLDALDIDPPLLRDGKPEQTLVWEEDGVLCRARLDWLRADLAAVDDVKTTSASASPPNWTRTMYGIGGDIQAAFYLRGLRAVVGPYPGIVFRWVVVETYPPYALSVVTLGADALALADEKIDAALELWQQCLNRDEWPAYPTEVVTVDAPPWEIARWEAA